MASKKTNVPASAVREWFNEAKPEGVKAPGTRGRLNPDIIAAFNKANRSKVYVVASEAEKRTITVNVVMLAGGRKTTKPVTVTTEHARALLGHPAGKRGRFDKDLLALALEAERLAE